MEADDEVDKRAPALMGREGRRDGQPGEGVASLGGGAGKDAKGLPLVVVVADADGDSFVCS